MVFDTDCEWDCSSLTHDLGFLQVYGKAEEIAFFIEAVHQGLKLSFLVCSECSTISKQYVSDKDFFC